MIYYCSVDGGNSTINIVINGKKVRRFFPSIQSDPLPAKASYANAAWGKDSSTNLWNKLHVETTLNMDKPNEFFRSEFLFGHMAEEYQKDLRSRDNKEKYQDKDLAKWMITSLAYSLFENRVQNENYKLKNNDKLQFNIILATGLPYREAKDAEKRSSWENIFKGVHRVEFKHPLFKGLTVDLVIEGAHAFVEAEMALTLELNKDGGIFETTKAEDLLNKKMAIIDIGGHTTEVVTIAYEAIQNDDDDYDEYDVQERELEVRPVTKIHLTDGIQRGVATIMEDIIVEINNEYQSINKPIKTLTRRDIELAFTIKGKYDGQVGWILPEKIYVKDMFDRHVENLAMDIVQKVHALYQNNVISEVDTIFLCGGGSRISSVVEIIKKQLGALGYNEDKIVSVADPVFANALGYYFTLTYFYPECENLS